MMKRRINWLICFLCSVCAYGQEFTYQATVSPVDTTAYYNIVLAPELLGVLRSDKADIRLHSTNGEEQPYLLRQEKASSSTSLFREYEIIDKKYKKDAISHLIFSNPDKQAINNVSFIVRNTDVQKRARLSGSDDQENWFVIKNNYLLHSMKSKEETTELKILNFPLSNYAFFKLEINDNWKLPIDILKAGYYDTQKTKGLSSSFDWRIVENKDSLKISYIKLVSHDTTYFERLQFTVSGAELYSRPCSVLIKRDGLSEKKKPFEYFETLASFNLSSNTENQVDLGRVKAKELLIKINNRDNQPLRIEKVTGSYFNQYLVARLSPNTNYVLNFGNKKLFAPQYDIASFASKIPIHAPRISHSPIKRLTAKSNPPKEPGIFDNGYVLWVVIGIVGLVLTFVSVKMIREIGN